MAFKNPIRALSELVADSITGAVISTAATGARWVLQSGAVSNTLAGYTGDAGESLPGQILVGKRLGGPLRMLLTAPVNSANPNGNAALELDNGALSSSVNVSGDDLSVTDSTGTVFLDGTSAAGWQFGGAGNRVRSVAFGSTSVTVTASVSGTAVVNHGLGGTPTAIVAIVSGSSTWITFVTTLTSTQFTLGVRQVDGTSTTATETVLWMAIR